MPGMDEREKAAQSTRPWCLFQSGPRSYAIGLESVAEVVEVERLVRLPHSPPRLIGMCTLRREVMPVISLGASEQPSPAGKHVVLILQTGRGPWALEVSSEGTTVAEEPLEGPPPEGGPEALATVFLGTVRRGETCYAVIDPDATWQGVRAEVERWYADHWVREEFAREPKGD